MDYMKKSGTWTVFIYHTVLNTDKIYLYGTVNETNKSICILSANDTSDCTTNLKFVGTLTPFSKKIDVENLQDINVKLSISSKSSELKCDLYVYEKYEPCTCVLYDPQEFQQSYIFMEKAEKVKNEENLAVLDEVYRSMSWISPSKSSIITCICTFIFSVLIFVLRLTGIVFLANLFVNKSKQVVERSPYYISSCLTNVASLTQLYERADFITSIVNYHQQTPLQKLRSQNKIWSQMLDCGFGFLFLSLFFYYDVHNQLLLATVHWTNVIAAELSNLINWLMGAPAGLKLNYLLTQFLGQFFLYHVYIWIGYVQLIQPLLSWIVYLALPISLLGFSFQISLIQDLLFLLTVHIYCFYVYAARIYNLEISAVCALWRLFRGKKWNVLRERIDTASYDIDQLFFGTLIFTILLFLLPTILLYYTVFLTFRIIMICIQGILSWVINLINTVQIYSLICWFIQSKSVAGNVEFDVVNRNHQTKHMLLTLQTSSLPLQNLLKISFEGKEMETKENDMKISKQSKHNFSKFMRKAFNGDLLFPWISPSTFTREDN